MDLPGFVMDGWWSTYGVFNHSDSMVCLTIEVVINMV